VDRIEVILEQDGLESGLACLLYRLDMVQVARHDRRAAVAMQVDGADEQPLDDFRTRAMGFGLHNNLMHFNLLQPELAPAEPSVRWLSPFRHGVHRFVQRYRVLAFSLPGVPEAAVRASLEEAGSPAARTDRKGRPQPPSHREARSIAPARS